MFASGRPAYAIHHVRVLLIDDHMIYGARGPTCSHKECWRVILVNDHMIFDGSIPYMYCLVIAAGGKALAIRGPGDRTYPIRVTAIGEGMVSGEGVPNPNGFIVTSRSDTSAIGRPG